jgi:hypothetical protein
VKGIPLPPPLTYVFILLGVMCALCLREEMREVKDLPNLLKSGRMFGWFPHLVNSLFVSICPWVWIESPLSMC